MKLLSKARTLPLLLLGSLLAGAEMPAIALPAPPQAPERQALEVTARARPLLEELRGVRLDPARAFRVTDLFLRRDAVRLHLRHGTLVFFRPVQGRVTGAVFDGAGEVLVLPPDGLERQQLAKFTGSPILTESFSGAYFRFSDDTFAELQEQVRRGRGRPAQADDVIKQWAPSLDAINNAHSLRLLLDFLEPSEQRYFYAGIQGERLGSFDVIVDDRRPEPVLIGQLRRNKESRYYDVWSSFQRRGATGPLPPPARVTAYRIEATLYPDYQLEVVCEVDLEFLLPARRTLLFQLSRLLAVDQVTEVMEPPGGEQPLEFFQNAALSEEEARYRASDIVLVTLPLTPTPSPRHTLRFRYHGRVIADVGSGVLFVRARDTWYPALDAFSLAHYELRFRYPSALELVAAGRLREARENRDWKEGVWVTDVPLAVAGFNVGRYKSHEVSSDGPRVVVYGNQQIEPALTRRLRTGESTSSSGSPATPGRRDPAPAPQAEPPPPESQPQQVGREVTEALATFAKLFGPVPYPEIKVSPIPARFAQGYPGLLYLSTYSFLLPADQERAGLGPRSREYFSHLAPAHEAAHQWWGNWVYSPDYRDLWISEGLAAYSALLRLERQAGGPAAVRRWLERYRDDLLNRDARQRPFEEIGALALGLRLNSSLSPDGYTRIIYSKGPWIVHMLRELLRDPTTGSDEGFFRTLRSLMKAHERPLTTADFAAAFETVLPEHADVESTGKLDWFFDQWVYSTGVPRYHLVWQARPTEPGWLVEGTVAQSDVGELFIMPVPVYARLDAGLTRLGTVVVTGKETPFQFPVPAKPQAVVLDPHLTVLAQHD